MGQIEWFDLYMGIAGASGDLRPDCLHRFDPPHTNVTSAPASANARPLSIPMPDAPPVTTARMPVRFIPATTSAAVDEKLNGVWSKCHDYRF